MRWLILLLFIPQLLPALETMPKTQWEFVSKYCTDCHDEDMYEGNVNLDFEKVNWQSAKVRKHWYKAYSMLERGKMPPKSKKKQPTSEERRSFMLWLDQKLLNSSPVGGTAIRRLNHREYRSTVQSVIGIKDFKLPGSFPKDINSHGFDTEAKMLVISPSHFESYTEAAVKVADYLFPPQKEAFEPREWNVDPKDMTISYSSAYIVDGAMRLASTGSKTRNGSWPTKFETPVSGKYKVTVVLSTFNPPKNKQPVFNLKSQKNGRGSSERDLGKFTLKEGAPQKFELEVVLYRGETLLFLYENSPYNYGNKNGFKKFLAKEFAANPKLAAAWAKLGKVPRGGIGWERLKKTMAEEELNSGKFKPGSKALEKLLGSMDKNPVNTGETLVYKYFEEGPNIGIHNVQIEGPLEEIEDQEIKRQEAVQNKFLGTYDKTDGEALTSFVRVYLEKAFRRQVQDSEVSKYVELVKQELAAGRRIEEGLHLLIRTSLLSPEFLFREKGNGQLSQDELAGRLAYFLTSSPPGKELREQNLFQSETLRKQVAKLLGSHQSRNFIEDFTGQWLDTNELDSIMPDPKLFRRFKYENRQAMKNEVVETFGEILHKNLVVTDFIDPDFIFTDQSIGEGIYQLKKMKKSKAGKVSKIKIERGTKQGGILSMPAVMMATANGVDTQPVLRGVWILENVLGTPTPEPPKNVPALPPDTADAVGPRAKLAAHMDSPSCKSCHEDIDPMGFVLENFDAVGRWRTLYPKKGNIKSLKIDASATMPNGTKLNDVRDLKKFLVNNPEYFTGCLAEKLMTYATGRKLNYREKKIISDIVAKNISKGSKFKDLLLDLIDSEVFKSR